MSIFGSQIDTSHAGLLDSHLGEAKTPAIGMSLVRYGPRGGFSNFILDTAKWKHWRGDENT